MRHFTSTHTVLNMFVTKITLKTNSVTKKQMNKCMAEI